MDEIGYLRIEKYGEKYSGGLLTVDLNLLPLGFKYTKPVEPTELQRILYGKSIERFIAVDLILKNLLKNFEKKVPVFIEEMDLFDSNDDGRLVLITEIGRRELGNENPKRLEGNKFIFSTHGRNYRFIFKEDPPDDFFETLEEITEKFDILEPFERISKALKNICGEG